jgi:hypothetical protein
MATAEQSIRVTAKGEFGQLQRGLKDLQGDLKDVLGEINKGARKGGIFDDSQLRALDVYKKRFQDTMGGIDDQFEKQNKLIDELHDKMHRANMVDKVEIGEKIKQRERELDVIRRQLLEVEKLYKNRNKEASGYEIKVPGGNTPSSSSGGNGGAFALSAMTSATSKIVGAVGTVAKVALGLASIGSMLAMVQEAYQTAYTRQVGSLDVAQRIRSSEFTGSGSSMYNKVSATGRRDNMGYTEAESWGLQDAYTSRAGALSSEQQYGLQKFSRGYGLDAGMVGSTAGTVKQLGGTAQPKQFADMIATSVSKSGMLPRIAEVMQAHTGLLQNINTTFKDGSSSQILAYQTTLDRLGNANGMTKLTGEQGASVISGLNGIFKPNNDKWQWEGIGALQNYNPEKYGSMGMYELQSSFEDGLSNTDNLPAMAKRLQEQSGGDSDVFKRLMQVWLQDGGFNATKSQVTELDKVTNGFKVFDQNSIDGVMGVDSGAKYTENREDDFGQKILAVEANFTKQLGDIGDKFLPKVIEIKNGFTGILEALNEEEGIKGVTEEILEFLKSSGLGGVLLAIGGLKIAEKVLPKIPALFTKTPGTAPAGAGVIDDIVAGGTGAGVIDDILAGGAGGAGGAIDDVGIALGANIRTGALTASETAKISELAGGEPGAIKALTQIFRSTGDMGAVTNVAKGGASAGDIIDMVSNGSKSAQETLTATYGKTGNISGVIDDATAMAENSFKGLATEGLPKYATNTVDDVAGAGAGTQIVDDVAGSIIPNAVDDVAGAVPKIVPALGGATKVLTATGKILSKIPLLGGAIDFGIHMAMGDNAEHAGASSLGMMGGSMGGTALGATIGGGIGALFGGVGAVPGAWLGGLIGGIGGGMAGDELGGKAYDAWTEADKRKAREASSELKVFADQGKLDVKALSQGGVDNLNALKDKGLISFGELNSKGSYEIKTLSEEGAEQLATLQAQGAISLGSMDKETKSRLLEISETHTSFLDKIGGVFTSLGTWVSNLLGIGDTSDKTKELDDIVLGKANKGVGTGNVTSNSEVTTMSGVTAKQLNNKLGGTLSGHGDDYIEAGTKYGIDPAFLGAISMHETGNGTSRGSRVQNNVGGMMKSGGNSGQMTFGSIEEGIDAMAKNLAGSLYIKDGLTTPAEIQKRYAPGGALNDPDNLNQYWLDAVTKYWGEFGGGTGTTKTNSNNDDAGGKLYSGDLGTMFDVGSRYVPYDMEATVHKGELITPANENPYKNSAGSILPSSTGGLFNSDNSLQSSTNPSGDSLGARDEKLTIDINLKGEGVSQLNSMTVSQLTYLIEQTVEALTRKRLSMNTSIAR